MKLAALPVSPAERALTRALLLFCLFGFATRTLAQEASPPAGTRVRVTLAARARDETPRTIIGNLATIDDSGIVILDPRGRASTIDRATVARLEKSQGRTSRWRFAGIGFAIGAGAGAALGSTAGENCSHTPGFGLCFTPGEAAAIAAIWSAGIGTAVGAAIPPRERWAVVPLGDARTHPD